MKKTELTKEELQGVKSESKRYYDVVYKNLEANPKPMYSDESIQDMEDLLGSFEKFENDDEEKTNIANVMGIYLGECIIKKYGGKWIYDEKDNLVVKVNENFISNPIVKVYKRLTYGEEDSVYDFYMITDKLKDKIPPIYKSK